MREVLVRNKPTLKGGIIKVKLEDALEAQNNGKLLSALFEEKYKTKFKVDMVK